jgi:hypothetical protein
MPGERRRMATPLWAKIVYVVLGPLTALAMLKLCWSMVEQHRINRALDALSRAGGAAVMPASEARAGLLKRPLIGMLYVIQELQQEPAKDDRMAKALALRRAADWTRLSTRRGVLRKVHEAMDFSGALPSGWRLAGRDAEVLAEMISERESDPELGYGERRVTEVLGWVANPERGEAKGFERVRVGKLLEGYDKKTLKGGERAGLEEVAERWAAEGTAVEKAAVPKLEKIIAGAPAELSAEEKAACLEAADVLEASYRDSRVALADVLEEGASRLAADRARVPHPTLYSLTHLLGYEYPAVRERVGSAVLDLDYHKQLIEFLAKQATRQHVNPVMAVETAKLTKEEHERKLNAQNVRRRAASIELLGRVKIAFCKKPWELLGVHKRDVVSVSEARELVEEQTVKTLEALREDPQVSEQVGAVLKRIEAECGGEGS